ncbi:hypothetical protein PT974_05816 [Cladobotryum mycophilum]|uniref:Transposase Tc1-like domain-containing protein n=1 Tax=Cladobotryum mycophilum TaxID=491253 RepID=A0ABR0SJU4_9HYPO
MTNMTDITTRTTVIVLKSAAGKTSREVSEITGLSIRTIDRIYARAVDRGFDPDIRPLKISLEFIQDAPRSGRPSKQTEQVKNSISAKVRGDQCGGEKSCADLAEELGQEGHSVSATTVWRVLKNAEPKKTTKPLRKPDLM